MKTFGAQQIFIIVSIVIAYILITLGVSIWTQKFTKNNDQFMTGGGKLPALLLGVLMVSEFIGTTLP